jgi:hypothetical protein
MAGILAPSLNCACRFRCCSINRFSAKPYPAFPPRNFPMPTRAATPNLTLPLAHPITLTRGPRSHLVTLMDAARTWSRSGMNPARCVVRCFNASVIRWALMR